MVNQLKWTISTFYLFKKEQTMCTKYTNVKKMLSWLSHTNKLKMLLLMKFEFILSFFTVRTCIIIRSHCGLEAVFLRLLVFKAFLGFSLFFVLHLNFNIFALIKCCLVVKKIMLNSFILLSYLSYSSGCLHFFASLGYI